MFTGIIQAVSQVVSLNGGRLEVSPPPGDHGWQIGESIAVSGVCLTLVSSANALSFDLSEETLRRSALGDLRPGNKVNLERAMRPIDRFGGHIVQGHVDAVGQVVCIAPHEGATVLRFRIPGDLSRYLIDKGSISIDGISLTVVEPVGDEFDVWVIPHTLENTNLSQKRVGDNVNLEIDLLAKYVERLLMK